MSDRELQSEHRDDHNHHSRHHESKSKVKSHRHHHCHRHQDRCRRRKAGEKHHKSKNERKRHHKSMKSNSRCRSGSRNRRSSERDGDRRNRDESSSKSPRRKHRSDKHSKGHEQKDPGNRRRHYRSRSKEENKLQILVQRNCEEQLEKRSMETLSQTTNALGASGTGNLSPRSKLVEQIQQRKLLFTKKAEEQHQQSPKSTGGSTLWKQPSFVDGKVSVKFKRLMGMKDDLTAPVTSAASSTSSEDLDTAANKQEKYFADLEKQFEVARMTTHTQRGFGFGYGSSMSSLR